MDVITLESAPRTAGKKETKAVRRQDRVPCVLYADGVDPVLFHVPQIELQPLIYTNETHRVQVEIDGESWTCILKEVDFHPVTDKPLHADFQVLVPGRKIRLTVPIRLVGTPAGVQIGGNVEAVMNEAEVVCLPEHMPSFIEINIEHMNIGDSIHIEELDLEGVEFQHPGRQTIVTVVGGRGALLDAAEAAEAAEAEELEEGEEAAEDEEDEAEEA